MAEIAIQCPPQYDDGKLYHFTTSAALCSILKSMQLKLSKVDNLNDLNELNICCKDDSWGINKIQIEKYIAENCKIISFSRNYYRGEKRPSHVESGLNHPRMWAQYAENNRGVCIVIDERRFLQENNEILSSRLHDIQDVIYSDFLHEEKIEAVISPEEFIKKHYLHVIFKKYLDWEMEHERRLFCVDNELEYLSIANSLEYICLGTKFVEDTYKIRTLVDTLTRREFKCFNKITHYQVWRQVNKDGRIISFNQYGKNILQKEIQQRYLEISEYVNKYL